MNNILHNYLLGYVGCVVEGITDVVNVSFTTLKQSESRRWEGSERYIFHPDCYGRVRTFCHCLGKTLPRAFLLYLMSEKGMWNIAWPGVFVFWSMRYNLTRLIIKRLWQYQSLLQERKIVSKVDTDLDSHYFSWKASQTAYKLCMAVDVLSPADVVSLCWYHQLRSSENGFARATGFWVFGNVEPFDALDASSNACT